MNRIAFATVCEALILTVLFMGSILYITALQQTAYSSLTECLSISESQYQWTSDGWLALSIRNYGISNVTVVSVSVNNITEYPVNPSLPFTVEPGQTLLLNITMSFREHAWIEPFDQKIHIELFTLSGKVFGIGIARIA